MFRWFSGAEILSLHEHLPEAPPLPPCLVEPLPGMTDGEALQFESHRGSDGAVQTYGLTPATATALTRFESIIVSAGGTITLTSAYRPPAYQEHLQDVWDKWMGEMRENVAEECQELRSEVEREFVDHGLLETQRPATVSDHTRGMAFDAIVVFPHARRRLSTDRLARRAGLFRPVATQDPVHFRLATGRRRGLGVRLARRVDHNRVRKQV